MYQVLPRVAIPFANSALLSLGIGGGVLAVEADTSTDFFKFFRDLVRY